jgi:hypothetical protein
MLEPNRGLGIVCSNGGCVGREGGRGIVNRGQPTVFLYQKGILHEKTCAQRAENDGYPEATP